MVDGRELRPDAVLHPPKEAYHALHVMFVEVADVQVLEESHQQPEAELSVAGHVVEVVAEAKEDGRHDHVHALDVPHLRSQIGVRTQDLLDHMQVLPTLERGQVFGHFGAVDVFGDLVLVRRRRRGQ